jgi:ribosomal protein L11 methyltransferase
VSWLQIVFDTTKEQAPALEDALLDLGALSVTLQDNIPDTGVDEPIYEPTRGETPLWQQTRLLALFEADTDADLVIAALTNAIDAVPPWQAETLADQAWERAWMDDFKPMRFGDRLWICPSWAEPPEPDAVVLRLDPGLAFGTGTHPTTALCLEWLDRQPLAGCTVLDYGCGSGILAIAALLLGAERAIAVDNDPQALIATRDNAERNGIAPQRLAVCLPEEIDRHLGDGEADVTLANILAGPLQSLAPELTRLTRTNGRIVLSGILAEQANAVAQTYTATFSMHDPALRGDWVRLDGHKQASQRQTGKKNA